MVVSWSLRGSCRTSVCPTAGTYEGVVHDPDPLAEEQDWFGEDEKVDAAKYRSLRDLLHERLTGATVFKVGKVKVAVYIVGRAKEGGWAGLRTTAVET